MKAESLLAFWLLPAEPWRSQFASLIKDLAARFDAPVFEPHLTLFVSVLRPSAAVEKLEKMKWPPSIELDAIRIEASEKYTKTLFVRFENKPALATLRRALADALGEKAEGNFDPHLSLIYRHLPNETKAELTRSLRIPASAIRFAGVKAIVTPAQVESRVEVESWQTVWEKSFQ